MAAATSRLRATLFVGLDAADNVATDIQAASVRERALVRFLLMVLIYLWFPIQDLYRYAGGKAQMPVDDGKVSHSLQH